MGIDHYKAWTDLNDNIAADNWYLQAFDSDSINLNKKNDSVLGVTCFLNVTGLGMKGAKLNGTVALTVGSASATLPITGSIDKTAIFR